MSDTEIGAGCGVVLAIVLAVGVVWMLRRHPYRL